jgi:hypothetical protein
VKQNLGSLIAEYRGNPISWREKYLLYLPASMVAVAMLAFGIWRYYYGYSNFGPVAAVEWSISWYFLAFIIAFLALLVLLLRLRVSWRRISIYENGIFVRYSPFKKQMISWSNIKGIASSTIREHFFGNHHRDHHKAILINKDAPPIKIDHKVEKNTELIGNIKEMLYPKLLPKLKKDLQTGNSLSFGKVKINQKGIKLKRRFIAWEHISSIYLKSGFLVVELHPTGEQRLPIMDIYNLELLLHFINEHIVT